MSGFMLCDDILDMVGKQVEQKREEDTRNYWAGLNRDLGGRVTCKADVHLENFQYAKEDLLEELIIEMMAEHVIY